MAEKKARFISNEGTFSVRVAPDSGELDKDGKPIKDGKITFTANEPTEVGEIKRMVTVNQRQPDGSYIETQIERTIDVADRIRKGYVPHRVSEIRDGETPKPKSKAEDTKKAK